MTANDLAQRLAVCSWSLQPESTEDMVARLGQIGLNSAQLALNDHRGSAGGAAIGETLAQAGVQIVSGMFGTVGEDYTTLDTIKETGGVVPDATWDENWQLVQDVIPAAKSVGVKLVTFHAGFLPEDKTDPAYDKLKGRLKQIADAFAAEGLELAFETGQEEAPLLKEFLDDLAAPNVGVNFDPANMLLYGKGDPVEALKVLLPYVKQIHIKDALPADVPGTWGSEVVVGTGAVDWKAFLQVLIDGNFGGWMCIEREANDQRVADITAAKDYILATLAKLS